jgi:cation-transporting P-type ATPase 13A2
MNISRDDVEKDLTFLGFLIMQNKLKSVTVKALAELNDADIRTIMATGDNMLTAISVGRKCGIIKEDQIVYLADLSSANNSIVWAVAKDSEEVLQDHKVGHDQ